MSFNKVPEFKNRSCVNCIYYYQEWDGEQGQIYCGDFCLKKGQEHYSNLVAFPFKKVMPCFEAQFWLSEFAELFGCITSDPTENGTPLLLDSLAFKEYKKHYNKPGIPIGSFRDVVDNLKKRPDFKEIYD